MGGTTSTHIANAYKGPVYAKADAERRYLTMEQYTANVGVEGKNFLIHVFGDLNHCGEKCSTFNAREEKRNYSSNRIFD